MRIQSLDHIQLAMPAGQEDQARQFYQALLGLEEVEKPKSLQNRGGAWFQIPRKIQIHLGVEQDFKPTKKAHPCFIVSDLDSLATKLEHNNYPIQWDNALNPIRRFYSEDCFGNRLEFVDRQTY